MCKVLGVSKSGFHKWLKAKPSKQELLKRELVERIKFHFYDSEERYGAPKITYLLRLEGYNIVERTVGKYMNELGLRSCVSRKFRAATTDSNHDNPISPNVLDQNFNVASPNQVWAADITYIPCREGRQYLASVMDLCTREIVGWRLGSRMTTDLVLGALEDACAAKKPRAGLIHHSDRGSQYASAEYRSKLEEYNSIEKRIGLL